MTIVYMSMCIIMSTCLSSLYALLLKGAEEDMEYYVREAGRILGVTGKLAQEKRSAKHILEHVFAQLVEFKKLNQVQHDDEINKLKN